MKIMAEFLAMRVYEKKMSFDEIPERFRETVKEILKEKYDTEADNA